MSSWSPNRLSSGLSCWPRAYSFRNLPLALSLLRFYGWCGRHNPLFRRRIECSFLTWLFFNLVVQEQTLVTCFASRFIFWCHLLCIPLQFCKVDIREDANTHKVMSYKYLSKTICTAVEEFCQSNFCLWRFCFSTRSNLVALTAQSGFPCRFWCTINSLMPETALVSLRTLAFSFHL